MDLGGVQNNVSNTGIECSSVPLTVDVGQTTPDVSIGVHGELPSINIQENGSVLHAQPPTLSGEFSILECDTDWASTLFNNPGSLPASAHAQCSSANASIHSAVLSQFPVQCTSPNPSIDRASDMLIVQPPAQPCSEPTFTSPSVNQGFGQQLQSEVLATADPACTSISQNHVGLFQLRNQRPPGFLNMGIRYQQNDTQQQNFSQLGHQMEPFQGYFRSEQPQNSVPNPQEMAEKGFTYHGDGIYQCQTCGLNLSIKHSPRRSDLFENHRQLCPRRYHTQPNENHSHGPQEQVSRKTPELPGMVVATDAYGHEYFLHGPVKRPHYAKYTKRLNSFPMMPSSSAKTPKELASAGFYFVGQPDQVACFSCGVGFRNWEPGDDPWVEHARLFPNCTYVTQVMDSQSARSGQQTRTHVSSTSIQRRTRVATNNGQQLAIDSLSHDVSNISLDATLSMSWEINYQAIADMGYQPDQIRRAITKLEGEKRVIDTESIVNEILEMDETKAISRCFQCHQEMRNGYTLLPCGHVAICLECDVKKIIVCPVCKRKVERYVVTYPSIRY